MGGERVQILLKQHAKDGTTEQQERLFLSLAEQLSQIFLNLTRLAEAAQLSLQTHATAQLRQMHDIAESAMLLTESYALNTRLVQHLARPEIEPIAVSSLFYDAAQQLLPLARTYGVELQLDDLPRMSLVMSDRLVLQSALISLGQVFITAEAEHETIRPLRLAAHRSRYGVVAGVYAEQSELSTEAFRMGKGLYGTARQPIGRLAAGPSNGVFVADSLLGAVAAKLHVARYHNLTGLATTLPACNQLQLI